MLRTLRSRLLLTYLLVIGVALSVIAIVTLVYLARNPSQIVQARYRLQVASEAIARRAAAISRDEHDHRGHRKGPDKRDRQGQRCGQAADPHSIF